MQTSKQIVICIILYLYCAVFIFIPNEASTQNIPSLHTNITEVQSEGTVTDIDGNIYKTVQIGNQLWMAENLKVKRYRNGDLISYVSDRSTWIKLSAGAYCVYDNKESNIDKYGLLYNWDAVNDSRNIAPEGWHIASDEEWKELEIFLGMSQAEANKSGVWRGADGGGKLKEKGKSHWKSPNTKATNETGFRALPGGFRDIEKGKFLNKGHYAIFWSSTGISSQYAWYRYLSSNNSGINRRSNLKQLGLSVRCIRDK